MASLSPLPPPLNGPSTLNGWKEGMPPTQPSIPPNPSIPEVIGMTEEDMKQLKTILGEAMKNPEMKKVLKEAMGEWLDSLAASFGRWSMMTLMGGVVVAIGYMILVAAGWHK